MKKVFLIIFIVLVLIFIGRNAIKSNVEIHKTSPDFPIVNGANVVVHFIDVGQGDSILIISPNNKTMLIDQGENIMSSKVVSYLKKQKINKVDILVATHPHEDHIGGMDMVINFFDIDQIYMPKISYNTKTFQDVLKAIKNKNLKINTATGGTTIEFDNNLITEILAPNSSKYESINNYSVVLKLTYKNTSFLFEGDAENLSEKEMVEKKYNLKSDVLKIAHHGSTTSTTLQFLKAVSPKYAVISVGKDNDYGHPHKKILERLSGIDVFRTDTYGSIVITSNGDKITTNKEK